MFSNLKSKVALLCLMAVTAPAAMAESSDGDFDVSEAVTAIEGASSNIGLIGTAIVVVGALVFGIGVVRGMTKT